MSNVPLPLQPLIKYADFQGRARRSEFWLFWLIQIVFLKILGWISLLLIQRIFDAANEADSALSVLDNPTVMILSQLNTLASLALLIPNLAVGVRRMHDINRTGWWIVLPSGVFLATVIVSLILNAGSLMALTDLVSDGATTLYEALLDVLGQSILLIWLPSVIAGLVVFVFHVLDGTPNMNRFGPDPKGRGVHENIDTTFS